MAFAKFNVIAPGRPSNIFLFEGGVVTIGRALDNTVSLADDESVSRYHAEIEGRGEEFWIIDLGSSNGVTVNDMVVAVEQPLRDGDLIGIGGSTIIEFHLRDSPWTTDDEPLASAPSQEPVPTIESPPQNTPQITSTFNTPDIATLAPQPAATITPSTGLSSLWVLGAVGIGLLLTGVVAVAIYVALKPNACRATVRIVSPRAGETITGPVPIRVEAEETKCIDRVIYQLDGTKVATSEITPYEAVLDPADLSGLTAGNHVLTVTIEDDKGNRSIQPDEVVLGFAAPPVKLSDGSANPESSTPRDSGVPAGERRQGPAADDIKSMCDRLAHEVSAKHEYVFDRELLHQIEARTTQFMGGGFYGRARPFRDVINDSFVNEQGLDPPLGYIMALSRSNFILTATQANAVPQTAGLWQIPLPLAQDAGYLGRCGNSTLSDPNQKCSALVAAAYLKALVVDLFGGDTLYAIACFGMTSKEAAQWRDQLPVDRRDLWSVIKSTEQRERLTRFFAAGIVSENPQKFGLAADSPLSNLYPKK